MKDQQQDPDLIAKNECVGALFAGVTGRDPFLNDNLRDAIDRVLSEETGATASLEQFVHKAMELTHRKGANGENFSMFRVDLRSRPYEPLWVRSELIEALKPMTGHRSALLVVSGLEEAVARSLPRNRRRIGREEALAEARGFIDSLAARFTATGCRLNILYVS
jgi:hypothetical protein